MLAVAIGSFLLLLVVAYLIARPLFAPETPVEESEQSKLLGLKQRLLTDVRELDVDFATGKLAEEDYRALRTRSMAEAAATLKALEESPETPGPREGKARSETTADLAQIAERQIESSVVAIEDELEREIAARRRAMELRACPGCGAPHDPDDRFCRRCGNDLAKAETG